MNILTGNMNNNANFKPLDEAGVSQLVNQLYSLKHFGKNLQNVKNVTARAHQATYRERPHRLPRNQNTAKTLLQNIWPKTPSHQPVTLNQEQFPPLPSRNSALVRNITPSSGSSKGGGLGDKVAKTAALWSESIRNFASS
jgi:hypothetical protein